MSATVIPVPGVAPGRDLRAAFRSLAPLFRYPGPDWDQRVAQAREHVPDGSLDVFAAVMSALQQSERQAVYTSTFDLAPSCAPYLGAHQFGDESPERARLMVGLRMRYGGEGASELPDHIAEIFAFATEFYEEEWRDLGRLIILPALRTMEGILRPSGNPYRHLLAAVLNLCTMEFSDGGDR
jgi:nitrate reductase assembly molybdenum cofactor insertion protein NarJ